MDTTTALVQMADQPALDVVAEPLADAIRSALGAGLQVISQIFRRAANSTAFALDSRRNRRFRQ